MTGMSVVIRYTTKTLSGLTLSQRRRGCPVLSHTEICTFSDIEVDNSLVPNIL